MAIFGIGRKSGLQRELQDAKQKNAYLKAGVCGGAKQPPYV
jgi:hypothetical protein